MYGAEIEVCIDYALRDRLADEPVRVRVLTKAPRGGQWRVEHLTGDLQGLQEWRQSRTLLCRWGDLKAVLRDEQRARRLRESSVEGDRVTCEAIDFVLRDASGEEQECGFVNSLREFRFGMPATVRLWERAQLDGEPQTCHPYAFVDRSGEIHMPFEAAYRFAKAFAAQEPDTVLRYVSLQEGELKATGWTPGERWSHDYLRKQAPIFALMRQWAGHEHEVGALREEIDRLAQLLASALYALERSGAVSDAAKLKRALAGK